LRLRDRCSHAARYARCAIATPGEVADVLAERELAVDLQARKGLEGGILLDEHLRALHVPSPSLAVYRSRRTPWRSIMRIIGTTPFETTDYRTASADHTDVRACRPR
jgi:hypothetical protein